MKRSSKGERKTNGKVFYEVLNYSADGKASIVIDRADNGRVRFLTKLYGVSGGDPVIIAEDNYLGIEGCWYEFVRNIKGNIQQISSHDDKFEKWIEETLGFKITFYDGFVYIVERTRKEQEV